MRYPAMQRLFYDLSVDPQNPTAANTGVTDRFFLGLKITKFQRITDSFNF